MNNDEEKNIYIEPIGTIIMIGTARESAIRELFLASLVCGGAENLRLSISPDWTDISLVQSPKKVYLVEDPTEAEHLHNLAVALNVAAESLKTAFDQLRNAFAAAGKSFSLAQFEHELRCINQNRIALGEIRSLKITSPLINEIKVVKEPKQNDFWHKKKYDHKIGWKRPHRK